VLEAVFDIEFGRAACISRKGGAIVKFLPLVRTPRRPEQLEQHS